MYVHERVTLELLINKHSEAAKNQKSQINFTCARLYNQYSHDLKYSEHLIIIMITKNTDGEVLANSLTMLELAPSQYCILPTAKVTNIVSRIPPLKAKTNDSKKKAIHKTKFTYLLKLNIYIHNSCWY